MGWKKSGYDSKGYITQINKDPHILQSRSWKQRDRTNIFSLLGRSHESFRARPAPFPIGPIAVNEGSRSQASRDGEVPERNRCVCVCVSQGPPDTYMYTIVIQLFLLPIIVNGCITYAGECIISPGLNT